MPLQVVPSPGIPTPQAMAQTQVSMGAQTTQTVPKAAPAPIEHLAQSSG